MTGIKNIIYWFPTIWKDRDWDFDFIYEILKKKLQHTEKYFRSDKVWSANAIEDADNMRYAINLIEKLQQHDYLEEALQPFNEKFPDYKWEMDTEICEDNPKMKRFIDKSTPEQEELQNQCFDKAHENEEKDYNELFDFLKTHLIGWWD
jgi:hypothetical protein